MQSLSVVIICKNEVDVVGQTLQSLEGLCDDIIVYDNGSTDGTQRVVKQHSAQLHEGIFEGFGKTKNKAMALAKNDWILCLDADEAIDEVLKKSLLEWEAPDETTVFEFAFKNFFQNKHLQYGEWGQDYHVRLFNRKKVKWDEAPVHENLLLPSGAKTKRIKGFVLHKTMRNISDYRKKIQRYAELGAEKYFRQGKKATWFKRKLSPFFTFINYYFLKLGFLDGKEGYACARMTAHYTFLKYARLKELIDNSE
ncbi:MAG: glycosyltransferase family 2 protein [Chitinophagaceae bacterium]